MCNEDTIIVFSTCTCVPLTTNTYMYRNVFVLTGFVAELFISIVINEGMLAQW